MLDTGRAGFIVSLFLRAAGPVPTRYFQACIRSDRVYSSIFMMKFPLARTLACALALSLAGVAFPGCSKIKSLLTKKHQIAPATAPAAPTPAAPDIAKASAAPTPGPAAPVIAPGTAINKSAVAICLCYHRFEEKPHDALAITPAEFTREMQALKDSNFTVIPMQDFLAWRRGEKDMPAKSAIITIDDGYISGYDTAWPILKKFNYPFTVFIYTEYIGSGGKSISWDQLAEMRDAGVDIESHTSRHQNLHGTGPFVDKKAQQDIAKLGYENWLRKEIIDSRTLLENQLGIKCNVFAYPFGKYNEKTREIVKEAGYQAAFTVYGQQLRYSSPPSDLLGRYAIEFNKPQLFQAAINMVGGGISGPPVPEVAQLAASSMITQPMQGETVTNPKPVIKANLASMGTLDPKSVEMRLSGVGLVPAKYDPATKTITYQVTQSLPARSYTVILSAIADGKRAETRWDFTIAAQKP